MNRSLGPYVTAPVPGTSVRATSTQADPTKRVPAQSVMFQALPSNTGIVWVGDRPDMDSTTGVGILAALAAPADPTTGPFSSFTASLPVPAAGLNANDYWILAAVADDGCIVSFTSA